MNTELILSCTIVVVCGLAIATGYAPEIWQWHRRWRDAR